MPLTCRVARPTILSIFGKPLYFWRALRRRADHSKLFSAYNCVMLIHIYAVFAFDLPDTRHARVARFAALGALCGRRLRFQTLCLRHSHRDGRLRACADGQHIRMPLRHRRSRLRRIRRQQGRGSGCTLLYSPETALPQKSTLVLPGVIRAGNRFRDFFPGHALKMRDNSAGLAKCGNLGHSPPTESPPQPTRSPN